MCNVCRKGKPTEQDKIELHKFAEFLKVIAQGESFGLDHRRSTRYAAIEVYGDENAEGN